MLYQCADLILVEGAPTNGSCTNSPSSPLPSSPAFPSADTASRHDQLERRLAVVLADGNLCEPHAELDRVVGIGQRPVGQRFQQRRERDGRRLVRRLLLRRGRWSRRPRLSPASSCKKRRVEVDFRNARPLRLEVSGRAFYFARDYMRARR